MRNLNITTRENFNGQSGKDFIIEGVGSFFTTNYQIRKFGGIQNIKNLAEQVVREAGRCPTAGDIFQAYFI